jgi:hypothetical protein
LLELLLKRQKPWGFWGSLVRAIHDSWLLPSYNCWKMLQEETIRCQETQVSRALKRSQIDRRDRMSCRMSSGRRPNKQSVDPSTRRFLASLLICVSSDGTSSVRSTMCCWILGLLQLPCWIVLGQNLQSIITFSSFDWSLEISMTLVLITIQTQRYWRQTSAISLTKAIDLFISYQSRISRI